MRSKPLLRVGALTITALLLVAASPENKSKTEDAARLNNLGCAYMNQQLFEKGLKYFQQAAAADPNLRVARINQGIAQLALAHVDEAKAILDEAAKASESQKGSESHASEFPASEFQKNDPHVRYALGMLDKNSANPEAAVEDFKRVIAIDDSDADTWYFLGTVYSQLKQFPQAIDAFDHALKLNPLHASAQFGLSRAYQQSGDSPHAREHLTRFQYITQNKLGSAMSLAYGEQGKYSLAEESPTAPTKVPPQIPVKFVDVTKEAGLANSAVASDDRGRSFIGSGSCFIDYDNDGKVDLFVADNGTDGGISLYHNLGGGKFEDVTKKAGLDPTLHAVGCTVGDYDNDGYADLALSFDGNVELLHNEKNGTFKDVSESAGIKADGLNAGLTFVDYDHDGDLDLYVVRPIRVAVANNAVVASRSGFHLSNQMWRNNGNGTFTEVSDKTGLEGLSLSFAAIASDIDNDRAIDLVLPQWSQPTIYRNPREGKFVTESPCDITTPTRAVVALDFDHDGWMDLAFTHEGSPALTLWHNNRGKSFEQVKLPETNWARAYGIAAFDYDNDGWVDLVAVGETKDGKGEIKLFRNLGPDGWKDVTTDVGLDKIQLKDPRAIITGDYDNDGATDLLITQNHGPAVLLKNEGGNKNNWLRLALKGLNDNKSAIGTKVEVFSDGIRQKYEIYGSNGYLGQNSPYLTIGLGQAKQADVVRMLWPGGVLQDEIEVPANKQANFLELDRRGSSCPTLFVWDGKSYQLVSDILGAGVVGHRVGPNERNIPRPTEWVKIDPHVIRELSTDENIASSTSHAGAEPALSDRPEGGSRMGALAKPALSDRPEGGSRMGPVERSSTEKVLSLKETRSVASPDGRGRPSPHGLLSFRLMEPMEEVVYLDAVKLVAVDHPANEDVYPNEYFASNPPYPDFKVITSQNARPPVGAWDDKGNNLLPDLLAHKYVGNFDLLPFKGFTKPHSLILDLGEPYRGGPLRLLMHGEIEYFTATGMYAASQAGIEGVAPYVEAEIGHVGAGALTKPALSDRPTGESRMGPAERSSADKNVRATHTEKWIRVLNDMGFPAGLPKTITVDLTGKVPIGSRNIRITTNLQIYWDNILIDRSLHNRNYALREIPLTKAELDFHGYPRQIEDLPPGNVKYRYEQVSRTGPYARQAGEYTRYGDVLPLLQSFDDQLVIFGSGEEVRLDFDPSTLPRLPKGWTRDYFFQANGYEKDMDFYAADGNTVEPLPFKRMGKYPYEGKFPSDPAHLDYMLKYNTRFVSGNEPSGYAYRYSEANK